MVPPHVTNEDARECIPSDATVAAGLPSKLSLVIGCRVMLLRNIKCNDGLVNGSCIVTNIESEQSGAHKPSAILVKFFMTPVWARYILIALFKKQFLQQCVLQNSMVNVELFSIIQLSL